MSGSASAQKLFLIDFDQTIIEQHLASLFECEFKMHNPSDEEQIAFVKHLFEQQSLSFIEEEKMRELILTCLQNDVRVVVCTFNPFVAAIKAVLTHMSPQLADLQIISKPRSNKRNGKNLHLQSILDEAREVDCIERVVLLDDDQSVLDASASLMASAKYNTIRYRAILAAPDLYASSPGLSSRYLSAVYHEFSLPESAKFMLPRFSAISEDSHTTPVRQSHCFVSARKRGRIINVEESDVETEADSRSSSRSENYTDESQSFRI